MPSTIIRPPVRPATAGRNLAPRAAVGVLRAGALAVAQGLALAGVVTWLLWVAEDRSTGDLADVAAAAGQLWLAALGGDLATPTGELGLTPLGLAVLPLLLARRAGRSAGARPGTTAVFVGGLHALVALVVALLAGTAGLQPEPAGALLGAVVVGSAGGWLGAGGAAALPARVPAGVVPVLRAGATAAALLLAAGALLGAGALAVDHDTAAELARSARPGVVGGLGLLLLGAVLVPNAVVWAAAWLAGPGLAVGVGTVVTPSTTELGAVPGLPLAAALPAGPPPSWAVLALVVPVLAGALATRRLPAAGAGAATVSAAGCGAAAGLLLGVLAVLSSGPLGGDQLSDVGVAAVPTTLAVAGEVALGAALGGLVRGRRRRTEG